MFERGGRGRPPPAVTYRCYLRLLLPTLLTGLPRLCVALALELGQQAIDLFLFLHVRKLGVHVVAHQFRMSLRGGFAMPHLALHAVERRRIDRKSTRLNSS